MIYAYEKAVAQWPSAPVPSGLQSAVVGLVAALVGVKP